MKKNWIVRLALCLALVAALVPVTARAEGNVAINETNFPDETFRAYVSEEIDTDKDGELSPEEIQKVTEVYLADTDVAVLTGLGNFTELKELDVSKTQLTKLTTAKYPKLEYLSISGCAIKTLDVSSNKALKELDCSESGIKELDVTANKELEELYVDGCAIKTLDVSKNSALKVLGCSKTKITALKVNKNTALTELDVTDVGLKSIDVSANEALEVLSCGGNKFTKLDVANNPALRELRCWGNSLKTLDVSANPALEVLSCGQNGLIGLDVTNNLALRELMCEENGIVYLDVSANKALEHLDCSKNYLTELSVRHNRSLEWLNCNRNALAALNLVDNLNLIHLDCSENRLNRLYLTCNPDLEWVECWANNLHSLDISACPNLLTVYRSGATVEYKYYTVRSYAQGNSSYKLSTDPALYLHDGSVPVPRITGSPRDVSVVEGKRVTFSAKAVGTGLLYRWYYRQPGSEDWIRLPGENGTTLTLTAEKRLNGNRYMCEVLNRGGVELTERAKLTVISKPVIIYQPSAQTAPEGNKVTFSVTASGEQMSYQWYRKTPNSSSWDKVNSGTSSRLTLTATEAHDGTRYRCVVSNQAGKVTTSDAKLTVLYKPTITTEPKDASVVKGKYTTFSVRATGGQLKYQWYMRLKGESSWTLIQGATDRTLEVRGTPKRDRSVYRCKVYNAAGQTYTETVKLYVQ